MRAEVDGFLTLAWRTITRGKGKKRQQNEEVMSVPLSTGAGAHTAASKTFRDRFAIHSSNSTSVYITAGIKPISADRWSVVLVALFTIAKK